MKSAFNYCNISNEKVMAAEINKMTLNELEFGRQASVIAVRGGGQVSRRLMEMGIIPGTPVTKIKAAPFGDPIQIRVRNYSLAVRKSEAEQIEVAESEIFHRKPVK